jgi:methylenetetrahydrofolate--tRNA-(uracil-5-)-methyltransferase
VRITVVGGGFAGCEAAWAAANRGVKVRLYEMRPQKQTPAHVTDYLAELVCSNSFKSLNPDSPAGQLKAEMEALGSLMIPTAKKHAVPGGEALAVDRNLFAAEMTALIEGHPNIEVVREEWSPQSLADDNLSLADDKFSLAEGKLSSREGNLSLAEGKLSSREGNQPLIIATGPLTSDALSQKIKDFAQAEHLHFYDAVAPTLEASSIDRSIVWEQSRYDKGDAAYLNCPFDQDQYEAFIDAVLSAEQSVPHDFEKGKYFLRLLKAVKMFYWQEQFY